MNKTTKRRTDTREAVRKLVRSHKSLLGVQRGQIDELGHLRTEILAQRRLLLEIRQEVREKRQANGPNQYDVYRDYRDELMKSAERNMGMSSSR